MLGAAGEFPSTVDAPRAARVFLQDLLIRWDAVDLNDDASLLLAELAANVVRHARTDFTVKAEWNAPTLRVEVSDGSSIIPAIKDLADEHGGLGLRMVASLADEWGIEQRPDGKAVWFVLHRTSTTDSPDAPTT